MVSLANVPCWQIPVPVIDTSFAVKIVPTVFADAPARTKLESPTDSIM